MNREFVVEGSLFLIVVLVLVALLSACSGNSTSAGLAASAISGVSVPDSELAPARVITVEEAVAEVEAYEPQDDADSAVFKALKNELVRLLTEKADAKMVSGAPTGDAGRVTDLAYDPGSDMLTWTYQNLGDYDLSGEVGVPDITPIAQNYLADTTDGIGDDEYEAWVDGDDSGEVGISDITPIANNYLNDVVEYRIVTSDSQDDGFTAVGEAIPYGEPGAFPKEFSVEIPAGALAYVAVEPLDSQGNPGERSNIASSSGAPVVSSVSPLGGKPNSSVEFSAVVSGIEPIEYSWNFGGGAVPNASTEQSPLVTLSSAGTYYGSLTVSNPHGEDAFNFVLTITSAPGPPNITSVSPNSGLAGVETVFIATVSGSEPLNFDWDFGGGAVPNKSLQRSPSVLLSSAGTYEAQLSVTNAEGSDTFNFILTVDSNPGPPLIIDVGPLVVEEGVEVTMGAVITGSPATAFYWDFGGAATPPSSTDASPVISPGEPYEHYQCSLQVFNDFGNDSFDFILSVELPHAITAVSPFWAAPNKPAGFSVNVQGAQLFTFNWNFGGASTPNTSSEQNPTVMIGDTGTYNCQVIAANQYGSISYPFTLYVGVPHINDVNPESGFCGENVSFNASILGTDLSYEWNFDGGSTPNASSEARPTVTLTSTGTFDASLTVSNSYGEDTLPFTLTVLGYKPVIYDVMPKNGLYGEAVQFAATVTGTDPLSYSWDFGGGANPNTSTEESPTVTLGDIGTYDATLQVSNAWGSDDFPFTLIARNWHIETVDSEGAVGYYTSIAVDSGGYPHVSYLDYTNDDLKYAYMDASGWHIETVDSEGNVGEYTSIALDSGGYAHVSYYDFADYYGDLKYAYMDPSGWHIETVDSEWDVGSYTSIALDSGGYPHVSYYDYTPNYDLKYAYMNASGWHIETVDSEGWVGWDSSIALDSGGYPHVSYRDYINKDLKYAYMDASGWHIETVDSEGDVGYYTSIALDSSGYPHVSYRDKTNDDLKYAYMDPLGWHIETVDSAGDAGWYSSIALDSDGYAHVSYRDTTNYGLKYAYMDASGWHTETVDSAGNVGGFTSIARYKRERKVIASPSV